MVLSLDEILEGDKGENQETQETGATPAETGENRQASEEPTNQADAEQSTENAQAGGDQPQSKGTEAEPTGGAADQDNKRDWAVAAVKDERNKRQELEKQVANLQGQIQAFFGNSRRDNQEKRPDWNEAYWEDPPGNTQQLVGKSETKTKIDISVMLMREIREDYDEVEKIFLEDAEKNQGLQHEMAQAQNPAGFAYEYGKKKIALEKYGNDPEKMREEIRKEERAKLEQEIKKNGSLPAANAPKTQAGARGAGTGTIKPWGGPTPLADIIQTGM